MPTIVHRTSPLILLFLVTVGCGGSDGRLVELSERSLARQSEQNQQTAKQSTEVAKATRQLVAADSQARQELVAAQSHLESELHTERASLDRQHELLEVERKELAKQRHREPILAAAIMQAAALLACVLPIFLCVYIVNALRRETPSAELEALLIQELAEPQLLIDRQLPLLPDVPSCQQLPVIPHDENQ